MLINAIITSPSKFQITLGSSRLKLSIATDPKIKLKDFINSEKI